jgi:uncharacterized protein (TIGR02246 family)
MKRAVTLVLGWAAIIAPAQAQQSRSPVQDAGKRWEAALNRHDVPALLGMYDADAWLMLPGAPAARGRDQIRGTLQGFAQHVSHIRLQTTSVRPLGRDTCIESGTGYVQLEGSSGAPQVSTYRILWHRDGRGAWKIVHDLVSA